MLIITDAIAIDDDELEERFTRAAGPGGQHVNTTSSAVELRFDAAASPNLPDAVKARALRLAGRRATDAGVIVIRSQRFRSQHQNREDARERLVELLARAAAPPPPKRIATKPTLASKKRRVEGKTQRSGVKKLRGRPSADD